MLPQNQPQTLRDLALSLPPSTAVKDAIEYYERTGAYRPEDVRRILGDPARGVEFGPGVTHRWLGRVEEKSSPAE